MVLLLFNLKFLETFFIRETLLSSFELLLIGWKGAKWTSYKFLYLVSKLIDLCWSRLEILISNKSYQSVCLFSSFIYICTSKSVCKSRFTQRATKIRYTNNRSVYIATLWKMKTTVNAQIYAAALFNVKGKKDQIMIIKYIENKDISVDLLNKKDWWTWVIQTIPTS